MASDWHGVPIEDPDQPALPRSLLRVFDSRYIYIVSQGSNLFFRQDTKALIHVQLREIDRQ